VECIYEPPQSATADSLQLERGTEEEQRADYIAELLGYCFTPVTAYAPSSTEVMSQAGHTVAGISLARVGHAGK